MVLGKHNVCKGEREEHDQKRKTGKRQVLITCKKERRTKSPYVTLLLAVLR